MEMEQVKKVARLDENPMEIEDEVKVDGGDERNENELSDMDQLPNEILMKVLDYLDEQQLVKFRILNSRWNEICCLLLQDKTKNNPDSKLVVQLEENMTCRIRIAKPLTDFIECFSLSEAEKSSGRHRVRPFPFSCFNIKSLQFNGDVTQIWEFFSTFGPLMKTFIADINQIGIPNFEKLWKLILHFAPNIEHLKIIGDFSLADIILFDPLAKFFNQSDPNFKVVNPNNTFLKNLKVLEIESGDFGRFNNFMKDLLDNTPNLEQVSSFDSQCDELQHLEVWQKLIKDHLLKNLEMTPTSKSNVLPLDLMKNLRLKNLRAVCDLSSDSVKQEKSMNNYIHHALKSSQDTLTSLHLEKLTIENINFCFKDISSLPNVRQLHIHVNIQNSTETGKILERFSQLCRNITTLDVGFLFGDFSKVAPILWTRFQKVKSLEFTLEINEEWNNPLSLDSAFSGYSQESIQNIQSTIKSGVISLEEARRGESQNPSILDLKDLSRLDIVFFMEERNREPTSKNHFYADLTSAHSGKSKNV